ncbi:MAG: histidine phosphatase family protein [Candidatus Limnocylindrales bacterium]
MTRAVRLALIRHGESAWIAEGRFQGQGDPPLSAAGERQAAAVAARLAAPRAMPSLPVPDAPPLAIWHSPLRRAEQTARAVHEARAGDASLRPLDELMELGQGEWEGLTHAEVRQRWPAELAAWRDDPLHHQAPGGESLEDGRRRVQVAREVMVSGEAAGRDAWAIVVAHDGILRLLMLDLLDIGIEHFWSFPLTLASVTVLDLSGDVAQLRAHNLDAHVAALGSSGERPPGAL